MNALEKLKRIDKGMTNIIEWDAVSGDLLRQMCAWQKQLKLAIHELQSERVAEPSNDQAQPRRM